MEKDLEGRIFPMTLKYCSKTVAFSNDNKDYRVIAFLNDFYFRFTLYFRIVTVNINSFMNKNILIILK